jgi:hypothetical protein
MKYGKGYLVCSMDRKFEADIKKILIEQGFIKISFHGLDEMDDDDIEVDDIMEAVINGEMVEDYPEDRRGHSCLIFGWSKGRPHHCVCTIVDNNVFLITVWIPDFENWMEDYKTRKKQV